MGKLGLEAPLVRKDVESQGATGNAARAGRILSGDYLPISDDRHDGAQLSPAQSSNGRSNTAALSTLLVIVAFCSATVVYLSVPFFAEPYIATDEYADRTAEFYTASRTGYHFQPEKNWMNDPNGPMWYRGYYHFFYQYNPQEAVWGNISWGHAVSTDLIHWMYLELALVPDQWYDIEGVWSGSATILPDGTPALLYTGSRNGQHQSQSMAIPVNSSDPLLRKWKKVAENPLLLNPTGISPNDFRDPTSAWMEDDGLWRITIGAKVEKVGIALLYHSKDFKHWVLEDQYLHSVEATGMWECVDFYPVAVEGKRGLNHSVLLSSNSKNLQASYPEYTSAYKYVLKVSLDDTRHDHYSIGTYSTETHTFEADDPALDTGIGPRYDYGKFYASKTFFDSKTGRRILWGWANESDSEHDDVTKGWASVQAIPRTIWLDSKTGNDLLQWPVEEVDALRGPPTVYRNIRLNPTEVVKMKGGEGPQLDIEVVFAKPDVTTADKITSEEEEFDCSQGGSAHRGYFGPFGILVLTDDALTEQTAIFFYIAPMKDGQWLTRVCSDQSRSSKASHLDTTVYGSYVNILPSEDTLSLRVLVDHSVVETFVQGGRLAITSRVYPTIAIEQRSNVFLFNNGSTPIEVKSMDIYRMNNVKMYAI